MEKNEEAATLAQLINDRMKERGIAQNELASRSGVAVATIRRIQHADPQPRTATTLAALSRALGWPDDYLRSYLRFDSAPTDGNDRLDSLEARLNDLTTRVERLEGNDK